jgi:hypothetical protein
MSIEYRLLRRDCLSEVHRASVDSFADYSVDMTRLSGERLLCGATEKGAWPWPTF